MSLKRTREPTASAAAAAPADGDDYEPITFEEAIESSRPAVEPVEARRELFVGNLDRRVTECVLWVLCLVLVIPWYCLILCICFVFALPCRCMVLKVFTKFGEVIREEFLWHKSGPRRGLPRGCCFV